MLGQVICRQSCNSTLRSGDPAQPRPLYHLRGSAFQIYRDLAPEGRALQWHCDHHNQKQGLRCTSEKITAQLVRERESSSTRSDENLSLLHILKSRVPDKADLSQTWDFTTRICMLLAAAALVSASSPGKLVSAALEADPEAQQSCIQGIVALFYSFTTLIGVFAVDAEGEGTLLYSAGSLCYFVALAQLYALGLVSGAIFWPGAALWAFGFPLSLARFDASFVRPGSRRAHVWQAWHDVLGVLGCAGLSQTVCTTFFKGCSHIMPVMLGLAAGIFLLAMEKMNASGVFSGAWFATPAWCATLIFMVQPAKDLLDGVSGVPFSTAAVISIASLALQTPRAIFLRNRMFFTGITFCSAAMCQFLLSHPVPLLSGATLLTAVGLLEWAIVSQWKRTAKL